jgi:hypothetical protein
MKSPAVRLPLLLPGAQASIAWAEAAALSGCCAYLLLFALPIAWDIPLVVLALAALLSSADTDWDMRGPGRYITAGVMLLVAATIVSTAASTKLGQSALGSAPMLPATLLFWIVRYRLSASHVRVLLLTLVALAALLSVWTIVAFCAGRSDNPHEWIRGISRIVTVPNDMLILAVLSADSGCTGCLR